MQIDVRNKGSVPELGRSPRGGHGNPLQYSCLENSLEGRASRLKSIGLQSWTQLSDLSWAHTYTQDCSAAISTEVYVCTHPPNCPSIHTSMYRAKLPLFLTWIFAIISLVSLYLLLPSTEIISHFNQPAVLEMQIWSLFCLKSFHDSPLLLGQKLQSFSKHSLHSWPYSHLRLYPVPCCPFRFLKMLVLFLAAGFLTLLLPLLTATLPLTTSHTSGS